MNSYTLSAIVVLALVATGSYFYGTKKNRWIVSAISKDFEDVLKPLTSNYVNIGGTIGYNFTYALSDPFSNAKGTITVSPRHSLLYLPISLLIGVRDRFFVNLFTKKKLRGEAHILAASHLRRANIAGIDAMERRESLIGDKRFILLSDRTELFPTLEKLLTQLPHPMKLQHFCAYPETKTFFIHGFPIQGHVKENVEAIVKRIPDFLNKEKE